MLLVVQSGENAFHPTTLMQCALYTEPTGKCYTHTAQRSVCCVGRCHISAQLLPLPLTQHAVERLLVLLPVPHSFL